ncbi:PRMT5-domain-containing protein [Fomitiporia mediterranea MF3/22]|uniref:PRMT5-domain-containing protein n=1 Tax=Fomitiporia mediterranea (strain MF3/22) TaxID=694068 RepID=UPI00044072AE|nr:PRMT5-domain-containing protein [Fomitiporia mediterranea MF3/22]EJD06474.1 PRMT5-domain-containing protein [Fomitiporia mediterranea MF3/22]
MKRKERERELEERAERWRAAPCFQREECNMTGLDEAEGVIGIASDWLELDSPDDWVRHDCEIALRQELAYASYLGLSIVVLPPPLERAHAASYGRTLRACFDNSPYMQLAVRLPLYDPAFLSSAQKTSATGSNTPIPISPGLPSSPGLAQGISPISPALRSASLKAPPVGELSGAWEAWDVIRTICGYNPRLTLALDLTLPLPSTRGILTRWSAEPVSHIFLPVSTFIPNAKGYPVLPKGTQSFLQTMTRSHPTIVLSGTGTGTRLHPKGTEDKYVDYIRYLEKSSPYTRRTKEANTLENYAQGYQDYLQMPLQPLQDHLASMVYENFERDPVKYQKYEEAIVLTVAGAGRGPLVARSLKAVKRSARNVVVYAIEKNPSAYVTLQQRRETEWENKVTVLYGDMRHLDVPERADILVSELLGSFGDNELSPECLDGAMRFLKDDGISIPSSYAAFLAPIQSAKLHHEAGGSKDTKEKDREKGLETPYVVMLQAFNFLAEDTPGPGHGGRCRDRIQQCWEFEHPRREAVLDSRGLPLTNSHNVRSASLAFAIPHAGILHGFAGYFEAVLYDNIGLSIHPDRKDHISKDMLSWFPCFFPIKEPLYLPSNAELRIDIWRLTGSGKVWYEWYAEAFLPVLLSSSTSGPFPSPPHSARSTGSGQIPVPAQAPPSPSRSPSMSTLSTHPPPTPTPTPRVNGAGSLIASPVAQTASPGPRARSPLLDAVDLSFGGPGTPDVRLGQGYGFPTSGVGVAGGESQQQECEAMTGVVKIGQTSLHNPGGRSSWYGL